MVPGTLLVGVLQCTYPTGMGKLSQVSIDTLPVGKYMGSIPVVCKEYPGMGKVYATEYV